MVTEFKKDELVKKAEDNINLKILRYIDGKCSSEETEEYIKSMLRILYNKKIISGKNVIDFYKRVKGKNGKRTLTEFLVGIKENCEKEIKFCRDFTKVMERKGEKVYFKNYGNEDKGRVRIKNYDSKPDVLFGRNDDEEIKMDIKRLHEQIFKIHDLGIYVEKGAGMIVQSKNSFWIYPPKTVKIIYNIVISNKSKYVFEYEKWGNKEVIKMGENGESGIVPINKLVEKGLIEKIVYDRKINNRYS